MAFQFSKLWFSLSIEMRWKILSNLSRNEIFAIPDPITIRQYIVYQERTYEIFNKELYTKFAKNDHQWVYNNLSRLNKCLIMAERLGFRGFLTARVMDYLWNHGKRILINGNKSLPDEVFHILLRLPMVVSRTFDIHLIGVIGLLVDAGSLTQANLLLHACYENWAPEDWRRGFQYTLQECVVTSIQKNHKSADVAAVEMLEEMQGILRDVTPARCSVDGRVNVFVGLPIWMKRVQVPV
ncbi:hypothetical protein NEOLI_005249 [Neolecta irregularis DAH-3]|uniref:Uncharacterized protein n=1 Tax=Neolecta irregularis (strain DAH-3) TaxID=1198029 RepID=A0A1U7LL48_NEOID|nr:hypothetical protein NEOLI_005249 [Neolecta irregularis DAH-3]|eukprot:OLL23374.1 hypothetical protein NEOLI_005249 [Neolecta irregularis DAH-3]